MEKCGECLYKFLSILTEICPIFTSVFRKTCEELWEKYANIGIDIDIDTREKYCIDNNRYFLPDCVVEEW